MPKYPNPSTARAFRRIPTGKTFEPEGEAPIYGDYHLTTSVAEDDVMCAAWGDDNEMPMNNKVTEEK